MEETADKQPNDNKKDTDLFDYLEIIARRKKLVLTVTLVAFAFSIVYALLLPKIYSATTRILPPQPDQGLMGLLLGQSEGAGGMTGLIGSELGTGTLAEQYVTILESEAIKDAIIDRFKLMELNKVRYRLDMYKLMEKSAYIEAGKEDGIISITVEDEHPEMAADIANAYVDELNGLVARMSVSGAALNRRFLEGRLVRARADLARSEDALKAFQSKNKVMDVPAQATVAIEGVAQLKAQLAVQEVQLSTLRRTFTDSSQEVKDASSSVESLKSQVTRLEGGNSPDVIPALGSVPSLGQEFVRLMREFKTQDMIVDLLTKQYELTKMTEAKDINTIQVIQTARVPDKKIKPKRAEIVFCVTFFSFISSIVWILFRKYQEDLSEDEQKKWKAVKSALSWRQSGNQG